MSFPQAEIVCHNGRLVTAAQAQVPVFHPALYGAYGIYESIQVASGVIFHLEEHLARLAGWLPAVLPAAGPQLRAELIAGGRPNLTYTLTDGDQTWILRRPPLGHVLATAHDMGREYRVMTALRDTRVPVPRTIALCLDTGVLGAPFYLMQRVAGTPYRRAAELAALRDVVCRHRARVISDEIHAPLVLPGARHVPYASLDGTEGQVTTLVAASKAWNLAGLKCAQIVAGSVCTEVGELNGGAAPRGPPLSLGPPRQSTARGQRCLLQLAQECRVQEVRRLCRGL